MDSHTLRVLEFDKIIGFLKTYASSTGGRKRCQSLQPLPELDRVQRLLREVTEMRSVLAVHGYIPISGVQDIERPLARSLISDFYLEPRELLDIKETLDVARTIKGFFSGIEETCPLLHGLTRNIIPLPSIESRIRTSIAPDGEILDTASPELAQIRSRLKSLRTSILSTLERMLGEESLQHAFQDDFVTIRNNRYVVPVRTDSKTAVAGVVHDQSQSKATFFIEPFAVVNQNNELQILRQEEMYEIIRVLTELTRMVSVSHDDILADLYLLEELDVIHARALFSKELNACEPGLNSAGVIELTACRHPILLARYIEEPAPEAPDPAAESAEETAPQGRWEFNRPGITPIELVKNETTSTLVITGANAGGKTVALKTLGLFTLMAQAGMHIPVKEGSRLCVYESIWADIGDEQNIEASLSTFSAHVVRIDHMLQQAAPSSLVLLDELGSGTDPAEGAALALSILDYLRERGCFTVVTTHLNLLKTYAYHHKDVQNVSVEFDPVTLNPLYSLVYGKPGLSNALAIARHLGMSERILQRADQYVQDSDREIIKLIQGLEKTQQELHDEQQQMRSLKEKARSYEQLTLGLMDALKSGKERLLKDFEMQARKLLKESEQELMKIIDEKKKKIYVRSGTDKEEFQQVKKKLYDQFPRTAVQREPVEHLSVGQAVRVSSLQKNGIVASLDEESRKAEVVVGTMKIKALFSDLEKVREQAQHKDGPQARKKAPFIQEPSGQAASKVNVIGMRVDEALPAVDKAIDQALLYSVDRLEIIHGVGTGRLMKAIREHVKEHPYVASFAPGDAAAGGAGVTVVEIKG
jgi:DNA mismatch repair protein MutS2